MTRKDVLRRVDTLIASIRKQLEYLRQDLGRGSLHYQMLEELLENRANRRKNFSELMLIRVLTDLILSRIPERTILIPPNASEYVISDDAILAVKRKYDAEFDQILERYDALIEAYDKAIAKERN